MAEKTGIVIPLDGSRTAVRALGAAQALAEVMDAVLHIVHVTDGPLPESELTEKLGIGGLQARDFVLHQIPGDVVDAVVSLASQENMKMTVMSSHGETFDSDALIGHIGMGIIQRSTNPVMVIRPDMKKLPGADWRPLKAMVPLNGSPAAAAVMDRALDLAEQMGCEIDVIHVAVLGEKRPREVGSFTTPMYLDYPQHEWSAWAEEFMERFAKQPPSVKLRLLHRHGVPADQMIKLAAESGEDLIILGWQGRLGKDRAKTIKRILRETEVPLVLIKTG